MRRLGLALVVLVFAHMAGAVALETIVVDQTLAHRYRVRLAMRVDAPSTRVYAVLTDYAHYTRLNPDVQTAQVMGAGAQPGSTRVETRIRACVAFFCHQLHQVQDVVARDPPGGAASIEASALPIKGEVRYSTTRWDLEPCGPRTTCMHFMAEFEPDFWIPPLIGTWLIERALEHKAVETCAIVEQLAQGSAS